MKILIIFFITLMFLLSGCVVLSGVDGKRVNLEKGDAGFFVSGGAGQKVIGNDVLLKALVKGSVYESGETVSVFGTCLDGMDRPLGGNGTFALLSAWYPNGTSYLVGFPMQEIQAGYYLYTGPMNVVGGTYLTQIECFVIDHPEITAKAFGEWQNPAWVHRIVNISGDVENLSTQLNNLSQNLSNITISIGNLAFDMNNSFEITWDKIESVNTTVNNVYQNLSNETYIVGQIANGSVDRNDSYLAQLLVDLSNHLHVGNWTGVPVNFTEDADPVLFWRTWSIRVDATDPETGEAVVYPEVICDIATSLSPTWTQMTDQGNHFVYEEFINSLETFSWNVSCYWT